ncbi:MAG: NAD(P)H-dependent oxidoreductase [Sedimentisphaerales bacterium]|nr:NAD(P)H-dependent oxidoreductase [Sedimentisphaerales bacterium]
MAKILITYYSRGGNTREMAKIIESAARQVAQTEVTCQEIDQVKVDDLLLYDAIIIGTPVYYGTMAAEIKKLIDDSVCHHSKLAGKIGGAFASSGNVGGGNETAIMDIIKAQLIHGMIIPGSAQGDHYGPVSIGKPDDRAMAQCQKFGKLIAKLTVKMFG